MFTKGNNYSNGRPKGSKNKAPNRTELIKVLDEITNDLFTNYKGLELKDKLQILNTFRHLYILENSIQAEILNNEIIVKIIQPDESNTTI
jgi:hypothetical protein